MTFKEVVTLSLQHDIPICLSTMRDLPYRITFTPYFWLLYAQCGTLVDQHEMNAAYKSEDWELYDE